MTGRLTPVRDLTRDEIAEAVAIYNDLANRWNEVELDRSKPLWSEWNGLSIGSVWGDQGPRDLVLYLNFCGLVITLRTPRRWSTWATDGLRGPWLRRHLEPGQVSAAVAYQSGPAA